MIAFVLSGTFLGIAGGIYAYYVTFLNTAAVFDVITSVLIVLAVLLGGRGTLWDPSSARSSSRRSATSRAPVFGGADAGAIRLLLFGGLLGAVAISSPRGPAGRRVRVAPAAGRGSVGAPASAAPDRSRTAVSGVGRGVVDGGDPSPALVVRGLRKSFGGLRASTVSTWTSRGADHRSHRPQRLGQNDAVQRDRRHGPNPGRHHHPRRPRAPTSGTPDARTRGARAHLSAPSAVRQPHGRREHCGARATVRVRQAVDQAGQLGERERAFAVSTTSGWLTTRTTARPI